MKLKIWEVPKDKVQELKKVLNADEIKDAEGKIVVNEFARNGYLLKDGKIIGYEKDENYLYIEASEEFFEKNEKKLPEGLKELEGEEFEKVKQKIEGEQEDTASGVGFIFGD